MSKTSQLAWLSAFLCVVFAPVLLYSFESAVVYTSLWKRAVPITGAQSLGLIVYTSCIAGRFRGTGYNVQVHRYVGEVSVLFVLAHVFLVIASNPENARLLFLFESTAPGSAATGALICFGIVLLLGKYRKESTLKPQRWRNFHTFFTWLGTILSFAHVLWINQLVNNPLWMLFFLGTALTAFAMWLTRPRKVNVSEQSVRH